MTNWRPNLYDELTVIAMAGYFNSTFGIKMGNSCIYMQDYLVPLGGLPGYLSWYKLCSSFSQETFTDIVDNSVVKCCSQFQNNTYSSVTLSLLYLGEVMFAPFWLLQSCNGFTEIYYLDTKVIPDADFCCIQFYIPYKRPQGYLQQWPKAGDKAVNT